MTIDPWNLPALPLPRDTGPAAQWRDWWLARDVDPLIRAQGFVLATGQLDAVGVSRSAGRHGVRTGRYTSAARGVLGMVAVRDTDESPQDPLVARRRHALAAAAAVRLRPDHVVSGRSAAILLGLPTLHVPQRPELTARHRSGNGRRNGFHIYPASIADEEITEWFGVPVLDFARTIVDLARHDRRDGIMAADAALYQELVGVEHIDRALARAAGWPGVRQARNVLALATPLGESPLESITRLAMHDDDFPKPELQYRVGAYRIDLALPESRLLIEADGRVKYRTPTGDLDADPLWQEKLREHAVRRPGWWIERVIWNDVVADWPATSRRLRRAMNRDDHERTFDPWRPQWS